jgi:hypothetical protein
MYMPNFNISTIMKCAIQLIRRATKRSEKKIVKVDHHTTGRVALEQIDDEAFEKLICSLRLDDVKEAIRLRPNNWWVFNIDGDTPLTWHAWSGRDENIEYMLKKHKFTKQEFLHKSSEGRTALKEAQRHAQDNPRGGHARIVELLRKAGATE